MNNYRTTVFAGALVALCVLAGCNKASDTEPKTETLAAPAVPEQPADPDRVQASADPALQPASAPAANAGAGVSVSGTEARAGDVSVKLPD